MKRYLLLLTFMTLAGLHCWSQTVIPWNQRRPDLYYYDTVWIDSNIMENSSTYLYYYSTLNDYAVSRDWISAYPYDCYLGRTCITDAPMKVLGIAAPVFISTRFAGEVDTTMAGRLPEYFILYQHEGDSIHYVDQTRWDTNTPQYLFEMYLGVQQTSPTIDDTFALYEAYFEKPVIVHDTFYVGGTTHNNQQPGFNSEYHNFAYFHLTTRYPFFKRCVPNQDIALNPYPKYHIRKYYQPCRFVPPDDPYIEVTYDTSIIYIWNDSIANVYTNSDSNHLFYALSGNWLPPNTWLPFFAIFDTNYVPGMGSYSDSCLAPTGLHIEGMNKADSSVTLAWNAGGETMWKLSVTPLGTNVNNGLIVESDINYLQVSGLDTSTWYVARVLAMCDTDVFGDWSDTVTFIIGTPPPEPDTTTCPKPEGFQIWSVGVVSAVLIWDAGEATSWEIELGKAGTLPGEGDITPMTETYKMFDGLDTLTWYWARLRTVCGADWYSNWTDTLQFYIPGSGGGQNPDDTNNVVAIVEQNTYMMPNPAREEVTVMSSFRVKAVELYGADGKLLQHKEVDAVGTTLDLKGLPAGIYFVRVVTTAGMTTKRLVIE